MDAQQVESGQYNYYFDSDRPEVVTRLIAKKHRVQFRRATRGTLPASVLEIGPGEGWFARACREAGVPRYLALEASPYGAQRLRDSGFDVVSASVPPMPEGLDRMDFIYASHVIEHLSGPEDVLSFLVACRQNLNPGGVVALAFPDARKIGVDFWDGDYTHRWPSTPRRVTQAARDAQLEVVAVHNCCLHFDGAKAAAVRLLMRFYPYKLLSVLQPNREEFWFRGKMLFIPEVLMLLRPGA